MAGGFECFRARSLTRLILTVRELHVPMFLRSIILRKPNYNILRWAKRASSVLEGRQYEARPLDLGSKSPMRKPKNV